jgi:hypothetical protein
MSPKGKRMERASKLYAFVLMPFSQEFDDIYQLGIKAACEETGIYCERVDETHVLGPIYDKIVNALTKADIIISDLTGRNPNVYYETGYAHAQSKVTIHLCQDIKEIPFDLLGFQHIIYSDKRVSDLKRRLMEKLLWASEHLRTKGSELGTLSLEVFFNGAQVASEISASVRTAYRGDGSVGQLHTYIVFDLFNSGTTESQYIGPVYIYSNQSIVSVVAADSRHTALQAPSPSDDKEFDHRHRVDFRKKLAAGEWVSLPLRIHFREGLTIEAGESLSSQIKLRFLTESIPLDLPLKLIAGQASAPAIDFVASGKTFPEKIEALLKESLYRRENFRGCQFALHRWHSESLF